MIFKDQAKQDRLPGSASLALHISRQLYQLADELI